MISENNLTAIIVEDEKASRRHLTDLMTAYFPAITLVSMEDTVQPAIDAIYKHQPDILFLDIEIKMGTGLDVLAGIQHERHQVIFTTAFDQFAIHAFQYHAVDYLLKPLDSSQMVRAVQRCIENLSAKKSNEALTQLLQYMKRPPVQQRLPVNTMYGLEFVDIDDILFVEAAGNYCKLKLRSGRIITLTRKIKELEDQLQEPQFMRIHNSYLVNAGCIRKYYKGRGGHVILDDESSLPVAPARKDYFLKLFG
jgi:two-component system LytT family response regulator